MISFGAILSLGKIVTTTLMLLSGIYMWLLPSDKEIQSLAWLPSSSTE